MKKWQILKPKIVDWYLDFSKESYTMLKSVMSSFNICFENYGQLKTKLLRPTNTSSTFLKFELSWLSEAMLKTRKNTIKNQFEQQWFIFISYQKPRRDYPAIWYNLEPFVTKKGGFKLSTPAKCTSHARLSKGIENSKRFMSRKSDVSVQNNVVSVCCSYLCMVFPYIENIKYPHGRTDQQQRFKSKREISKGKDCVSHSLLSLEAMYDSWSALPFKYEPGQNRIRTFLKSPVVFSGFSLLIPQRSSLAVFAAVQDVVHPVFHVLY